MRDSISNEHLEFDVSKMDDQALIVLAVDLKMECRMF